MRAQEWAATLADTIRRDPPADDQLPDVVADLQAAERTLADVRRMLMSEVAGPTQGQHFRIVSSRSAKRSYNTDGLLAAFGGLSALPDLVAADAVRLQWRWSELRRKAEVEDVTLIVASHEIGDGDEALIGENWTTELRVEAK